MDAGLPREAPTARSECGIENAQESQPLVWPEFTDHVLGVAMSGDGRWVVAGGSDGTVRVRDREHSGSEACGMARASGSSHGRRSEVTTRRRVVSGGSDGTVRIRDREHPNAEPQGWLGRQSFITSVAVSGDGHWVATGGDDGRLWVWNREHPEVPPLMLGRAMSCRLTACRWAETVGGSLRAKVMARSGVGVMDAEPILMSKACKFAARKPRSGAEWQLYLSDENYRETCPGQLRPDANSLPSPGGSAPQ